MISVRHAQPDDVDAICRLGAEDPAFAVSERIPFYERSELEQWVSNPGDNILLVLEQKATPIGFCFCKVISHHWAMLDNFYVSPMGRRRGHGRLLMDVLQSELRSRSVRYLSALALSSDSCLGEYLSHNGFSKRKTYDWYEMFI